MPLDQVDAVEKGDQNNSSTDISLTETSPSALDAAASGSDLVLVAFDLAGAHTASFDRCDLHFRQGRLLTRDVATLFCDDVRCRCSMVH